MAGKSVTDYYYKGRSRKGKGEKLPIALCTERCKNCAYAGRMNSTTVFCDYIGITGRLRGCDAGDNCARFKELKKRNRK